MVDLLQLGWDAGWEEAFASYRAAGLQPGRVAMEDKHAFSVVTTQGEVDCRVAGRLMRGQVTAALFPKVGDWVALSHKPTDTRAVIQHVLPRRTSLTRRRPGRETTPQVLAANVDVAFIVQAMDLTFNLRRLERFLVMTHESGAQAVVVLNKADLAGNPAAYVAEVQSTALSDAVLVTSAHTGHGIEELRGFLSPGRTCVFIGTSGVGKSSLINCLHGEVNLATFEVREQDGKGRHITTWRELILMSEGGLVIDTPGVREVQMWTSDGGLSEAFPDVAILADTCHFRACSHTTELRCSVRAALDDGRLSRERFTSFQKLQRELDQLADQRRGHSSMLRRRESGLRRKRTEEKDSSAWESS